jgi:hypothetical protein
MLFRGGQRCTLIQWIILSRFRGSVTNNNGFWLGWLYLLTLLLQSQQLTINDCLRLALFCWTMNVFSSYCDWLGSDLRVGHFFSFRCPLVSTPQLNTQLSSTTELPSEFSYKSMTNELSNQSQSQSHIATDGQSVSQSVLVSSPIWGSWPDIYYCLTLTVFLLWGALSDDRTGLSFVRNDLLLQTMTLETRKPKSHCDWRSISQ